MKLNKVLVAIKILNLQVCIIKYFDRGFIKARLPKFVCLSVFFISIMLSCNNVFLGRSDKELKIYLKVISKNNPTLMTKL